MRASPRFDLRSPRLKRAHRGRDRRRHRQGPFIPRIRPQPVGGGSIHRAWQLSDGVRRYFVKTNELARHRCSPPKRKACRPCRKRRSASRLSSPPERLARQAFLVLEHLDLANLDPQGGARLGEALAQLHRVRGDTFGWSTDNFIGATPQQNTPTRAGRTSSANGGCGRNSDAGAAERNGQGPGRERRGRDRAHRRPLYRLPAVAQPAARRPVVGQCRANSPMALR
jgi:hypothetical protein